MELEPNLVVGGRYRLERRLGKGGMGEVWAATHAVTRRRLALKFLTGPVAPSAEARQRFLREARAASAVEHPNVVTIHDVFELEDGTLLMVMDLLEGETLGERLRRLGELSLEATATLLLPVVSAVGTAHEKGIVHRDLKPDNIFIAKDGETESVKVLDFGIAKLFSAASDEAQLTGAGAMLGTPCYMAPEQAGGEADIDHRADEWAIGVILYEALAGGRPVEGDNLGQVLTRLLRDGIAPIKTLVPDLPDDVADVIGRLLSKQREDRPADLREVATVLSPHSSVETRSFAEPGSSQIDEVPAEPEPARAAATKPPRRRWAWVAAAASIVVLAGVGARLLRRAEPAAPEPPPAPDPPVPTASATTPEPLVAPRETSPADASARPSPALGLSPRTRPSASAEPPPPRPEPSVAPSPAASAAPVRSAKPSGLVEDPPF